MIGNATNLWDTTYVGNVADVHVLAIENLLHLKSKKSDGNGGSAAPGTAAGETVFHTK